MTKQTIFLATFISHVFSTHNCFGMELTKSFFDKISLCTTNQDFITLDSNLYTTIINREEDAFPLVFEETDGVFSRQTSDNLDNNSKVLSAMFHERALYYTKHQGVIIYNTQKKLTLEQVEPMKDMLETLLNPNNHKTTYRTKSNIKQIKPAIKPDNT